MKTHHNIVDSIPSKLKERSQIMYKQLKPNLHGDKILDMGINEARKAKITGNKFLDQKVYFNADMKLGSNV